MYEGRLKVISKFIYSEKATNFCEISIVDLSKYLVKPCLYFISIPNGWPCTCISNITLSLPSYTGSALKGELNFCNGYLSLLYFDEATGQCQFYVVSLKTWIICGPLVETLMGQANNVKMIATLFPLINPLYRSVVSRDPKLAQLAQGHNNIQQPL